MLAPAIQSDPHHSGALKYRAMLAGVAFFLCAATPAPPVQSYNTYKSWLVACDNTLSCEAKGFDRESGARAQLSISREAGPQGKLQAVVSAENQFGADDIRLDGIKLPLMPGWHRGDAADGADLTTDSPAAIRDFVTRIRNGKTLSLLDDDTIVPLDGFTAALLRMDERQGRLGGETALLNPGPARADKVPAAVPTPRIPAHPVTATLYRGESARLIAETRRNGAGTLREEQCATEVGAMQPVAYALDQRRALVLVPCIMGAYQGDYVGFLADRSDGKVRELKLPLPYLGDDPDHGTISGLTEAEFDPTSGMLSIRAKGRGLADCGTAAIWGWNDDIFRLISLAMQRECGGVEPGDWPVLFRSTQ
jgi:Protein of unknown function (DUF1176)